MGSTALELTYKKRGNYGHPRFVAAKADDVAKLRAIRDKFDEAGLDGSNPVWEAPPKEDKPPYVMVTIISTEKFKKDHTYLVTPQFRVVTKAGKKYPNILATSVKHVSAPDAGEIFDMGF